MKVAQGDEGQATLVGLEDTQQIHRIGAPALERVPARGADDRAIMWALIVAIVLAAGALGVSVISLVSSPDAIAGPQGPMGPQGAMGAQGAQGVPGPQGPTGSQGLAGLRGATGLTGKQGPAGPAGATGARGAVGVVGASGTVVASSVVPGTAVLSAIDPSVGTAVTATATCPQGELVLGGGAQVSAPGTSAKDVVMRSSFPTNTNGWRSTGSVVAPLGVGDQMSVRPYVLCGRASH
jgi:Collagen triple helix repeat (20 copies)